MSQIEFQCPYCEFKQDIEIENMSEQDEFTINCDACNKQYLYSICYSLDGITRKKERLKG